MIPNNEYFSYCFLGLGKTGLGMIDNLCSDFPTMQFMAADWNKTALLRSHASKKLQILKNTPPEQVITALSGKLSRLLDDRKILFLCADMGEEIIREYVPVLAREAKKYAAAVVCILLIPPKGATGDVTRKINAFLLHARTTASVVSIPIGKVCTIETTSDEAIHCLRSIGNYFPVSYDWEMYEAGQNASLVQRSLCIEKQKKKSIPSQEIVRDCIGHIIAMTQIDYINTSSEAIVEFLRIPGLLHLVETNVDGPERAYMLDRKLSVSNLGTRIDATRGVFLHLTVPPDIKKDEIKYLCEHIHGRTHPESRFDLCITPTADSTQGICARILAANTCTEKEWEEMAQF